MSTPMPKPMVEATTTKPTGHASYDLRQYTTVKTQTQQNKAQSFAALSFADYIKTIESLKQMHLTAEITAEMKERQPAVKFVDANEDATAFLVDYDEITPAQKSEIDAALAKTGLEYFVHTSSSSTSKKPKIHIMLPLREPVPKPRIHSEYDRVLQELGLPANCDQRTKSGSRMWFIPKYHVQKIRSTYSQGESRLEVLEVANKFGASKVSDDSASPVPGVKKMKTGSKKAASWLRECMNEVLRDSFAEPAKKWLKKNVLDELRVLAIEMNPVSPNINVRYWCPDCEKEGKRKEAWLDMVIATGVVEGQCRRDNCRHKIKLKPSRDEVDGDESIRYDVVTPKKFGLAVARNSILFRLRNVDHTFWYWDPKHIYGNSDIVREMGSVLGLPWPKVQESTKIPYKTHLVWSFDFPKCSRELTQNVVMALDVLDERHRISYERLHIVSGKEHRHGEYYRAPVNGVLWGRRNMPAPSISIAGKSCGTRYDFWLSPISYSFIKNLGYKTLSPRALHSVLRKLPPVIVVVPPKNVDELARLLWRQRLVMALERGCHVIVQAGSGRRAARDVAKQFGIVVDRHEIGLKRLHKLVPMPENPFKELERFVNNPARVQC